WPLGHGPLVSALYGTRTRLTCVTNRSPHPLRHRAEKEECPAGVAPAYPTRQVGAWAARPRTQKQGRKEANLLGLFWRQVALPGARPYRAEETGLEPARAIRLARLPTGCHRASWLALPS